MTATLGHTEAQGPHIRASGSAVSSRSRSRVSLGAFTVSSADTAVPSRLTGLTSGGPSSSSSDGEGRRTFVMVGRQGAGRTRLFTRRGRLRTASMMAASSAASVTRSIYVYSRHRSCTPVSTRP